MSSPDSLRNVRVVLSHARHPGNIGAAARAMKTMGLRDLWLVNPRQFPDAQADAMASGAADLLARARVCSSLDDALAGAVLAVATTSRYRDLPPGVLSPREAAARLAAEAAAHPVALVFGSETFGLSTEEVSRCQNVVNIPADPDYASLNLAAAVQVMAYEVRLASGAGPTLPVPEFDPATLDDIERLYQALDQALQETGFLDPRNPGRLMQRLRRLFSRTRLEKEEVAILRGILKSIAK
jgi:TrmH family RNA methyltransferase